eukprot:s1305_g5.t1
MHEEVAASGAAKERLAAFKEVVVNEMRKQLKLESEPAPKRARQRGSAAPEQPNYDFALQSARLLVTAFQDVQALKQELDGYWINDKQDWFDSLSRPLGTAVWRRDEKRARQRPVSTAGRGKSEVRARHTSLRNLGNSCWLNSVLQCFFFFASRSMTPSCILVKNLWIRSWHGMWKMFWTSSASSDGITLLLFMCCRSCMPLILRLTRRTGVRMLRKFVTICCKCILGSVLGSEVVHRVTHRPVFGRRARRAVSVAELVRTHFALIRATTEATEVVILEINVDHEELDYEWLVDWSEGDNSLYMVSGFVKYVHPAAHYVSYVRTDKQWLKCDGSNVTVVNLPESYIAEVPDCEFLGDLPEFLEELVRADAVGTVAAAKFGWKPGKFGAGMQRRRQGMRHGRKQQRIGRKQQDQRSGRKRQRSGRKQRQRGARVDARVGERCRAALIGKDSSNMCGFRNRLLGGRGQSFQEIPEEPEVASSTKDRGVATLAERS